MEGVFDIEVIINITNFELVYACLEKRTKED